MSQDTKDIGPNFIMQSRFCVGEGNYGKVFLGTDRNT
jgi:hypothetical protein